MFIFFYFILRILLKNEIKDKMGMNKLVNGIIWKFLVKEVDMDIEIGVFSIWRNDRLFFCGVIFFGGFKGFFMGIC